MLDERSKLCGRYLGHSGFLLELPSATLLFDWCEERLPSISHEKPLYVFISHTHEDHFSWDSFFLAAEHYPAAQIFFGYDNSQEELTHWISQQPECFKEMLIYCDGEQELHTRDENVNVRTLVSTDMGVAFVVDIENLTIYHAGDLGWWARTEDVFMQGFADLTVDSPRSLALAYEEYLKETLACFRRRIAPLNGMHVDYAMLPMDPRNALVGGVRTVQEYLSIMDCEAWTPMHLWGQYDFVDEFVDAHPELAKNMIGVTNRAGCLKGIAVGEDYDIGSLVSAASAIGHECDRTSIGLSKMASIDGINYCEHIIASVGDTVHFKVAAKNLGSIATTRIAVKDQLPVGLVASTEAVFKDARTKGTAKAEALSSDFFTAAGSEAYQLSVGGAGWYIEYDAIITEEALSEKGRAALLINTVSIDYALADGGYGTLGSEAAILVLADGFSETGELPWPEGSIDYTVSADGEAFYKLIRAAVGDEVWFRIDVRNIGDIKLTNTVLKSSLPSGFSLIPGSIELRANDSTTSDKMPDSLFSKGWNLGTIGTGNVIHITFRIRISDAIADSMQEATSNASLTYDGYTPEGLTKRGAATVSIGSRH